MITLTAEQAQQIEEALVNLCNSIQLPTSDVKALSTIRAARAQADHFAGTGKVIGCAYCDNPLFAGTKCNNCGRVTLAEQAEQEQVAVVGFDTQSWRNLVDALTKLPDGTKLYAEPSNKTEEKPLLVQAWEKRFAEQAEQEPVGYVPQSVIDWLLSDERTKGAYSSIILYKNPCGSSDAPLYAAPVRTKDLTDDELWALYKNTEHPIDIMRAVIAADREKNK